MTSPVRLTALREVQPFIKTGASIEWVDGKTQAEGVRKVFIITWHEESEDAYANFESEFPKSVELEAIVTQQRDLRLVTADDSLPDLSNIRPPKAPISIALLAGEQASALSLRAPKIGGSNTACASPNRPGATPATEYFNVKKTRRPLLGLAKKRKLIRNPWSACFSDWATPSSGLLLM